MATSIGVVGPGNELAGKVALITGAGRNIGEATAYALAQGGAKVALNTRAARDDIERVAEQIRASGGQAEAFMADIADGAAVGNMVDAVRQRFGKVDILVLNASVRKETAFIDLSFEEWRSILSISLDGAFHLVKACLPSMLKAGEGAIVTLGGMMALSGAKRRVHGSVAKHGLVGMTRALARELAEHNIRVNCVAPGQMDTVRTSARAPRADPKSFIPLDRLGDAREIADTVRFLCGPGASYIAGQTIHVNGGAMMF